MCGFFFLSKYSARKDVRNEFSFVVVVVVVVYSVPYVCVRLESSRQSYFQFNIDGVCVFFWGRSVVM